MKVIRSVADKIIVLKQGKIIEDGIVSNIFDNPKNIYTKKLLESII